jgi:hypothetical protein
VSQLPTTGVATVGALDVAGAAPAPFDRVVWAIVPGERCHA